MVPYCFETQPPAMRNWCFHQLLLQCVVIWARMAVRKIKYLAVINYSIWRNLNRICGNNKIEYVAINIIEYAAINKIEYLAINKIWRVAINKVEYEAISKIEYVAIYKIEYILGSL
jgi:hypothetical protein